MFHSKKISRLCLILKTRLWGKVSNYPLILTFEISIMSSFNFFTFFFFILYTLYISKSKHSCFQKWEPVEYYWLWLQRFYQKSPNNCISECLIISLKPRIFSTNDIHLSHSLHRLLLFVPNNNGVWGETSKNIIKIHSGYSESDKRNGLISIH